MDVFSLRLDLEGFSDELADSIGLYDVLTIRGMGDEATPVPSHAERVEEVAAPATPV